MDSPPLVLKADADQLLTIVSALRGAGAWPLDHCKDPEDVLTLDYREKRLASGALELTVVFHPSERLRDAFAALGASEAENSAVVIRKHN
jgi:hypothetical protein